MDEVEDDVEALCEDEGEEECECVPLSTRSVVRFICTKKIEVCEISKGGREMGALKLLKQRYLSLCIYQRCPQ